MRKNKILKDENDSKKEKHILINLSSYDYAIIKTLAVLERRSISEIARLILIDNASKLYCEKYSKLEPASFIPESEKNKK